MRNELREAVYKTGGRQLTPRQRRRMRHKANHQLAIATGQRRARVRVPRGQQEEHRMSLLRNLITFTRVPGSHKDPEEPADDLRGE
jgi:hypothetical protein